MNEIKNTLDQIRWEIEEIEAEIEGADFDVELNVPRHGMIQVRVEHMGVETEVDFDDLICDLDKRQLGKLLACVQEALDED